MITGVILARNEELNILDCITALRPHVSELLLIDMESADRTVELSRDHVDRILSHPLDPQFDAARNLAIPVARNDWLWFIDADERVPAVTGKWANDFVRQHGDSAEAVMIPFKTHFCGKWIEHCGWWPGYTMPRLLKRGYFRFSKTLHAGVELSGRQIRVAPDPNLAIEHFSYRDIEHYLEKLNRYTSTEAKQLTEKNVDFDWRNGIRHMMADLWGYYEANRGHLDGEHGWILSWLSGQYRWLSHAKLLDKRKTQNGSHTPNIPASLDDVLAVMREQLDAMRAPAPKLPLGILWRSPVWDPSGYADECRTFLKALARGDRPLRLEDIRWSAQECELPEAEAALLRALARVERPRFCAAITDCIPTTCTPDANASLNILRTTFETDRIPEYWLPHLEKYDEIWVTSRHNLVTFRRSGVAPEKLRAVASCVDTERYTPEGAHLELPPQLNGRFVFLSVFDWAYRKGWDVLLKAYCQEFGPADGVGLLLKLTRSHLHPMPLIAAQANSLLESIGTSLGGRPDIVLSDEILNADAIAALYRSVNAFVMPSRGEGWGRPYMEAMASGISTIGTRATGNLDFMNDTNSFLIDTIEVPVPEQASREIPVYDGHCWHEPSVESLQSLLRQVFQDADLRAERTKHALQDIRSHFGLTSGRQAIESALTEAERRFVVEPISLPEAHQVRVELEGELFACHSFSKVNEQVALGLIEADGIALSLRKMEQHPTFERHVPYASRIRPYVNRTFDAGPDVVIRHMFPPNWTKPQCGKWVHIQPWEYGHLPGDWIAPLKEQVDEIWVPSNYVKGVYTASGIPESKIQVIPWGIDPHVFSPEAPSRLLPSNKRFRFIFLGGTIARKGFDLLLDAYLSEFTSQDDVCLVVKDSGTNSFYRDATHRVQLKNAIANPKNPEILYFDEPMTEGQLASLYTACHCFVAPYRGEGFGLPIIEAMACGLAPIVPAGGASDDFVSAMTGFVLPARLIIEDVRSDLCGPPSHLEVSVSSLRTAMRRAFENPGRIKSVGNLASQDVRSRFTWANTTALMISRLTSLVRTATNAANHEYGVNHNGSTSDATLGACVLAGNSDRQLAQCLARLRPFVARLIVCDNGSTDSSALIAKEYGAEVLPFSADSDLDAILATAISALATKWAFGIDGSSQLDEFDLETLSTVLAKQAEEIDELKFRLRRSFRSDGRTIERLLVSRTNHAVPTADRSQVPLTAGPV
jgi:glycosyltransferase involved in cell wall biosynthesis